MRKLLKTLAFGAMTAAFSVAASASEITTNVDAADVANFGTEQTVFGADGVILTVSEDSTGYSFKTKATDQTNYISIASGKTLTATPTDANRTSFIEFTGSNLYINGGGTFQVNNSNEIYLRAKNLYVDSNTTFNAKNGVSFASGTLHIYGTWKSATISQGGGTITMYSGSNVEMGNAAFWANGSKVNIDSGATFTANHIRFINTVKVANKGYSSLVTINGTATIRGTLPTGTGGVSSAAFGDNLKIGATGVLTLNGVADACIVKSLDVAGTMSMKQKLYLADGNTLTLREGAKILTNGVSSQFVSVISIANTFSETGGTGQRPVQLALSNANVTKADVTVNIFGAQALGGFEFYKDSKLTINFEEGSSLAVNEFLSIDDYEGDFIINLTGDWSKNNFKINDMSEKRINRITFMHDGVEIVAGKDYELIADTASGMGYWFNAIPEPSTYAMVLGGLAIAFAFMRRRR